MEGESPRNERPSATKPPGSDGSGTASATEAVVSRGANAASEDNADVVRDEFILDFISGTKEVKETPKELVRQRIARARFHEYGISVDDMAADFPVRVGGRRRRVDIAKEEDEQRQRLMCVEKLSE